MTDGTRLRGRAPSLWVLGRFLCKCNLISRYARAQDVVLPPPQITTLSSLSIAWEIQLEDSMNPLAVAYYGHVYCWRKWRSYRTGSINCYDVKIPLKYSSGCENAWLVVTDIYSLFCN